MFWLLTTNFVLPVSVQSATPQQCQGHSVISSNLIISSDSESQSVEAGTWCTSRTSVGCEQIRLKPAPNSVTSLGRGGGTAPGDTNQGVTPE